MDKVAQLITRMVPGGASRIVRTLIDGLGDRFDIDLITGADEIPPDLEQTIPRVNRIIVVPTLTRNIEFFRDVRALGDLSRILREQHYDLVHTHTSKAGMLGRWTGWWSGVDALVHTPHGLVFDSPEQIPGVPGSGLKLWLLKQLERITGRHQDTVIGLTRREKRQIVEMGLADPESVRVIYNGIDVDSFRIRERDRREARQKYDVSEHEFLIVTVGRVSVEKGHRDLVNCFRRLRSEYNGLKLIIAGEGPLREQLRERNRDLIESGRLLLPGYVEDVRTVYFASDLYAHPARFEGFGLSILEAMGAGRPIVASRAGGIPELVRDGRDGVLVEPGSVRELAAAIKSFLEDEERRVKRGKQAARRAQDFDRSAMVSNHLELYRNLLESA